MSRPLRIEYPGAYYHVMNRGRGRQTIFPAALCSGEDTKRSWWPCPCRRCWSATTTIETVVNVVSLCLDSFSKLPPGTQLTCHRAF